MAPSDLSAVLSSVARLWLPMLLDASIKAGAVLLIAWGITLVMRRASAAARHAAWLAAVIGVLLLPAVPAALPGWRVLPTWAKLPDRPAPAPPTHVLETPRLLSTPFAGRIVEPPDPELTRRPLVPEYEVVRAHANPVVTQTSAGHAAAPPTPAPVRHPSHMPFKWPDRWGWLFIAWACGSAAVLLPSLVGALGLLRLGRRATRINEPEWSALVASIARELGIRRRVTLLSAAGAMPMTWGVVRPRLLLPREADRWDTQRRRMVLLHELGHVARWDCLAEWVGRIACAVYWFHPLLWVARRHMLAERERACDDLVLRAGHSASGYAEHLLAVASGATPRSPGLAIAMARRSQLEMRLRRILDERISRRALTRVAAVACVVAACGLIVPLAMVRASDQRRSASAAAPAPAQSPATRPSTRPAAAADDGPQREYALRTVDEHGKPLGGVKLWVDKDFPDWPLCNADEDRHETLVESKDDGTATVVFPQTKTNVVATKKGFVPTLLRGATLPTNKPLEIRLRVGQTITGSIADEQNRPIAGAKIRATRQRFILDYVNDFVLTATSDASGHFELEHAAEGPYQILAQMDERPIPLYAEPAVAQVPVDHAPAAVQMTARPGARIRGRYVTEHNLPLGGRRISVFCRLPKSSIRETTTEPDGSFVINGIPIAAKGQIAFAAPRGYVAHVEWAPLPPLCDAGTNELHFDQLMPRTYDGVVVRLLKEAIVEGTLRDEQGKPYVKADVIVDQTHYVYFTDAAGRFSAPIPPLTDATLRLASLNYYDYDYRLTFGPIRAKEGEVAHKDLVVRRKPLPAHDNELAGRVVDERGEPVAGARVYLANYGILPIDVIMHEWARTSGVTLKWKGGQFLPATVTADKDGRFSFNLLRDGKTDVFAEHEGAQWAWVRDVGTNTKDLKLTLEPKPDDATFGGSVADENGNALPGVAVKVYSGDYFRGGLLAESKSDSRGAFSIRVSPRPIDKTCVRLICRRDDGAIAWRTLPSCGGDDIRIRFKPTAVLRGRVFNKRHGPVAGATVWCDLARDGDWGELMLVHKTEPLSPRATTDAEGRFELKGLPAGSEATLFASHPDFERGERWYIQQIGPDTVVADIELPDGITVEGSVKFADTGKPAAGITVAVLEDITHDPLVPTTTDAEGQFTLKGLSHMMFFRQPTPIRADSADGEWSGTFDYPNPLYAGDHVAGVEILLKQSFASSHRKWLAEPGKPVSSQFRGVVLDDADPAHEGKPVYHDTLTVYDADGQPLWHHDELNFGYGGVAAVQNPSDGLLWVYENQAKRIQAFTPQGKLAWRVDAENVNDMAADPQTGHIWVKTYGRGRAGGAIQIRTPAGAIERQFDASGLQLAYSPADRCFWLAGRKVQRFDVSGKVVTEAPVNMLFGARALAVNPQDGSVWVVEGKHPEVYGSLNRILVLAPDGQVRREIDLGNTYSLSLALDPVRRVAWLQTIEGVRRISFDGQTLAELPIKGQVRLEPDTGCAWVAGTQGVYRLDPDGRCLWAHESNAETDKFVVLVRP